MRKVFFLQLLLSVFIFTACLAQAESPAALYDSADSPSESAVIQRNSSEIPKAKGWILTGAQSGLYKVFEDRTSLPLWTEGKVTKIIKTFDRWYFLTAEGVLSSTDLAHFELRNNGLPALTIKQYENKEITFRKQTAPLKDLAVHPQNSSILVTATKDAVYITYDAGLSWKSLGSTSNATSGIKAVAVCSINIPGTGKKASVDANGLAIPAVAPQTQLVVFMSHTIYGFSYYLPEKNRPAWNDCNGGFDNLKTQGYPDEISDILPVVFTGTDGFPETEVFVSQTFMPRLYRFDWATKRGQLLQGGKEPADTIDGLYWDGSELLYTRPGEIASYNPATGDAGQIPQNYYDWCGLFSVHAPTDTLYAAWIPESPELLEKGLSLSELWLLKPSFCADAYASKALDKKAVYCPANRATSDAGIAKYRKLLKDNKLNALVIDMKDDYGLLRYETTNPEIKEMAYVSRYHIDIDKFVKSFKEDGVYLVARIVTFKDKNLSQYANGRYAIWNKSTNRPWIGTKGTEEVKDENGNVTGSKTSYYDENWVDPYCPDVWEYNVKIAQELIQKGFDEIQFDYIRFPTDGKNLGQASYRYKSEGMDKESALVSFLRYARKNINAPIGIDIYGANGWYRSGTRTGQEVELLADYVDVICPMFYPNHFENSFLNYSPWPERPYRIYFYGTYRNTVIGRNRIIVRPWVQAFYLNVSYDRQYYNSDYVRKEVYGVRDSVNKGYMYWNNSGRYDDLTPDVGDSKYPWTATEASAEFRKPALSSEKEEIFKPVSHLAEEKYEKPLSLLDSPSRDSIDDRKAHSETKVEIQNTQSIQKASTFPSIGDIKRLWQAYGQDGES